MAAAPLRPLRLVASIFFLGLAAVGEAANAGPTARGAGRLVPGAASGLKRHAAPQEAASDILEQDEAAKAHLAPASGDRPLMRREVPVSLAAKEARAEGEAADEAHLDARMLEQQAPDGTNEASAPLPSTTQGVVGDISDKLVDQITGLESKSDPVSGVIKEAHKGDWLEDLKTENAELRDELAKLNRTNMVLQAKHKKWADKWREWQAQNNQTNTTYNISYAPLAGEPVATTTPELHTITGEEVDNVARDNHRLKREVHALRRENHELKDRIVSIINGTIIRGQVPTAASANAAAAQPSGPSPASAGSSTNQSSAPLPTEAPPSTTPLGWATDPRNPLVAANPNPVVVPCDSCPTANGTVTNAKPALPPLPPVAPTDPYAQYGGLEAYQHLLNSGAIASGWVSNTDAPGATTTLPAVPLNQEDPRWVPQAPIIPPNATNGTAASPAPVPQGSPTNVYQVITSTTGEPTYVNSMPTYAPTVRHIPQKLASDLINLTISSMDMKIIQAAAKAGVQEQNKEGEQALKADLAKEKDPSLQGPEQKGNKGVMIALFVIGAGIFVSIVFFMSYYLMKGHADTARASTLKDPASAAASDAGYDSDDAQSSQAVPPPASASQAGVSLPPPPEPAAAAAHADEGAAKRSSIASM